jgi:oligopeptide/dipeptide ABC transporter ATP-binding protein
MALLEVDNLHTFFFSRRRVAHAVDGVSFTLEQGKTLGIAGESGCGKTVTALSIMGLLPRSGRIVDGSIRFEGVDLTALPQRRLEDLRGRQIAMVFQDPMTSLSPTLRIGAQISDVLRRHLGLGRAAARRRSIELLEEVRIPDARRRIDAYPYEFSGGMRQRAMIASAIACNPKLLIADEPTTALDVTVQAEVLDLLDELRLAHDMAMIIITHDMGVIAEVADDVLVMYAGQVVESAPVIALFERPEHPYTEALLAALPQLEGEGVRHHRLPAIPGRPPDLTDPPPACRFAPRCPYAGADRCTLKPPELRELRSGHWVRSAHPASERAGAPAPLPQ